MKISKISLVTLMAPLVLGGTGINAQAADVTGTTHSSQATASFEADSSKEPVVDPTHPDTDAPVVDPKNPGTDGPLSIDFASNFDFGKTKISARDKYVSATGQKTVNGNTIPLFVQLTDKRGTGAGWKLQLTQDSQLTATDGSNHVLTGAEISVTGAKTFSNGHAATTPKIVKDSFTLNPGDTVTVEAAAKNEGQGTWFYQMGNESNVQQAAKENNNDARDIDTAVKLMIPGGLASAKSYAANLTWTLEASPSNAEA